MDWIPINMPWLYDERDTIFLTDDELDAVEKRCTEAFGYTDGDLNQVLKKYYSDHPDHIIFTDRVKIKDLDEGEIIDLYGKTSIEYKHFDILTKLKEWDSYFNNQPEIIKNNNDLDDNFNKMYKLSFKYSDMCKPGVEIKTKSNKVFLIGHINYKGSYDYANNEGLVGETIIGYRILAEYL